MKPYLKIGGILFAVIILSTSLVLLQGSLEEFQQEKDKKGDFIYVPHGRFLKVASLGFEQMISDLYWLRAVQHIGDKGWESKGYPYLFPLLDLVTDLDPRFEYAYEVGGIVLSVYTTRIEESNRLLKKGLAQDFQAWEIPFYLGFNHFYYMGDYEKAAFYMSLAARIPNRPAYVPRLATRLYVEAGSIETALEFLDGVKESTRDERVKKELEKRVKEIIIERDILFLEKAVGFYKERYSDTPENLDFLISTGILKRLPEEPFGGYYFIDPETGEIKSSTKKERLRLYKTERLKKQ